MNGHALALLADDFVYLEGLRYRDSGLWVSDMWDRKVLKISDDGSRETVCDVPERPSGIGFLPDGTPLVVSMIDRKVMKIVENQLQLHADLSGLATGELNDLIVDSHGRAYVGNFGFDLFGGEASALADLILIDVDGSFRIVAESFNFPNGMAFLDDERRLVVAETFSHHLTVFDRAADGSLLNRRVHAPLGERTPDGICVDGSGGIWVSSFATGEFVRVLEGGELTDVVTLEGKRAVSCALGGPDGRSLLCSTFAGEIEEIQTCKRAGAVETLRVDVAGVIHARV